MSEQNALTVTRVGPEANAIIENLFEHYLHDMAEWFRFDTGPDGRYGYDMAKHWARGDRVYLARVGDALAGFALVGPTMPHIDDPLAYDVDEFFVIRRYRRAHVGERLARTIWDAERGQWLVRVFEGNKPAVPFWRDIVGRYTNQNYVETRTFHNAKWWAFFTFRNDD